MKKILFLLLFVPASLFGQGAYIPARTVFGTVNGVTRPIAGAKVTVCAANTGGIPCSPALANTVFQDSALTVPLANPFSTDSNGNYPQAALAAGTYTITESASGFAGFSYQLSINCTSGTACTVGVLAATSATISGALSAGSLSTTGNAAIGGTLSVPGTSTLGTVNTGALTATSFNTIGLAASATIAITIANACNANVPGTAWMPVGAFSGIAPIIPPSGGIPNNCAIKCPSLWGCKLSLANGANNNFFSSASAQASNITIEGMILDGNQANQSGTSSIMYFPSVNGLQVRNNQLLNAHNHAVFVDGCALYTGGTCTTPVPSQNVWIENNIISAPVNGHGVELGNGPAPADTVVQNFHVNYNTILHNTSALVNGIFTLGASSVGVCGTGPGEIIGNTINGATDTAIEVGQGSCQIAVANNTITLGSVNGTTGIGVRSAQEVAVTGNIVHGTSTNTSQVCLLPWNNAGNDDLQFKNVTFENNSAKGCNGNAVTSATYTSGGSITGTVTQTCNVAFSGGATGTVALTGSNTIAGGTTITIVSGGTYTTGTAAPTSATLSNGTATCSGTAVVASTITITSFDVQVNLGNAGTAGKGNTLRLKGTVTDGGPTAYNYLSLPDNFDPQNNDDERINSTRTKPARSTQDTAGDGFYPYTSPIFQGSSPLNVEMRASNVALPNGLYRLTISGSQWLLQRNTAAAGDFSSSSTEIGDDGSGNISIQQGQLIAQGIGGFRDTGAARFDEGTPGGVISGADVCQGNSISHNLQCSMNSAAFQNFPLSFGLHSSYTNATTTFSTISDGTRSMSWAIAANTDYTMDCTFVGQGSATTAGPKFQLTGPASPTLVTLMVDGGTGTTAYANGSAIGFSSTNTTLGTLGVATTNFIWHVNASVINGANSGTLTLQAAANGAGTLTISGGSCQVQ